jgi:hypothetical protein
MLMGGFVARQTQFRPMLGCGLEQSSDWQQE